MNDKPCIIEINGNDYYYPCDYRDNIVKVGNSLVNVGSSTITLYSDFVEYNNNTSGYPRIYLPSNTKAYYRSSYNANTSTLVVSNVSFKSSQYSLSVYLMIVLICVMIINLFRR